MNVMQPQPNSADEGTGYDRRPTAHNASADRGWARHADGRIAAPLLAPRWPVIACHWHAARGARSR